MAGKIWGKSEKSTWGIWNTSDSNPIAWVVHMQAETPSLLGFLNNWEIPKLPWLKLYPMTDPNGAAIYGVPWIPSIYPLYVSIYASTMDPMGYVVIIVIP